MIHHAKKSLGQNFLKSKTAISAILDAGDIHADDIVLEIGPGKGALTGRLTLLAGKVIAIEKDSELISILEEKFSEEVATSKLDLKNGDILEFDPEIMKFYKKPYKIIANIPYYITGAVLRKFLSSSNQPELMVLVVQKEVADRIVARDNKESILSLSVKAYGTPKYVMKVQKRFFSPEPRVDSAIIAISNISKANFKNKKEEDWFFDIIKAGFAHKRKVLRKNLEEVSSAENIAVAFSKLSINEKSRAEDIPLSKWLLMAEFLSPKKASPDA